MFRFQRCCLGLCLTESRAETLAGKDNGDGKADLADLSLCKRKLEKVGATLSAFSQLRLLDCPDLELRLQRSASSGAFGFFWLYQPLLRLWLLCLSLLCLLGWSTTDSSFVPVPPQSASGSTAPVLPPPRLNWRRRLRVVQAAWPPPFFFGAGAMLHLRIGRAECYRKPQRLGT